MGLDCTGDVRCPAVGASGRFTHPLCHFARHADPLFFEVSDLGTLARIRANILGRIDRGTPFALWLGSDESFVPPLDWLEPDIFPEGEEVAPIDVASWYRNTVTKPLQAPVSQALFAFAFGVPAHIIEDVLDVDCADALREGAKALWSEPYFNLWARNVSFNLPARWNFSGDLRRRLKSRAKLKSFDLRDPKVSLPTALQTDLIVFSKQDHLKRSQEPRRLCSGLQYLNVDDARIYSRIP